MEPKQHIRILQLTYAAQLADSVEQYGRAGVLEQVTAARRAKRLATGAAQAGQLGISEPAQAFTVSAKLFGCADWTVAAETNGGAARPASESIEGTPVFIATAHRCLLCTMVKDIGGPSPCRLCCLDPMEAMVHGLAPELNFDVQETLYEAGQCRVRVAPTTLRSEAGRRSSRDRHVTQRARPGAQGDR